MPTTIHEMLILETVFKYSCHQSRSVLIYITTSIKDVLN